MLAPVRISEPAPVLVRAPVPEMMPESVSSLPFVSKIPPPAWSVTDRVEEKLPKRRSVPPSKFKPPEVFPRLLSEPTARTPALIVEPPAYVLLPESVSVPAPVLVKAPVPLMTPVKVASEVWLKVTVALLVILPCKLVVLP